MTTQTGNVQASNTQLQIPNNDLDSNREDGICSKIKEIITQFTDSCKEWHAHQKQENQQFYRNAFDISIVTSAILAPVSAVPILLSVFVPAAMPIAVGFVMLSVAAVICAAISRIFVDQNQVSPQILEERSQLLVQGEELRNTQNQLLRQLEDRRNERGRLLSEISQLLTERDRLLAERNRLLAQGSQLAVGGAQQLLLINQRLLELDQARAGMPQA
jgi:hypothetical protein